MMTAMGGEGVVSQLGSSAPRDYPQGRVGVPSWGSVLRLVVERRRTARQEMVTAAGLDSNRARWQRGVEG